MKRFKKYCSLILCLWMLYSCTPVEESKLFKNCKCQKNKETRSISDRFNTITIKIPTSYDQIVDQSSIGVNYGFTASDSKDTSFIIAANFFVNTDTTPFQPDLEEKNLLYDQQISLIEKGKIETGNKEYFWYILKNKNLNKFDFLLYCPKIRNEYNFTIMARSNDLSQLQKNICELENSIFEVK